MSDFTKTKHRGDGGVRGGRGHRDELKRLIENMFIRFPESKS